MFKSWQSWGSNPGPCGRKEILIPAAPTMLQYLLAGNKTISNNNKINLNLSLYLQNQKARPT